MGPFPGLGFFYLFVYFQHLLEAAEEPEGGRRANSTTEIKQPLGVPHLGWRFHLRGGPKVAQTHAIFLQNGQNDMSKESQISYHCHVKSLQRQS